MIKLCVPDITQAEQDAVCDALRSGWLAHGPYNKQFEAAFADYVGVDHALTCNSCTSALFAVLKALGIRGEVIIPSFSFTATANAVLTAGAVPRFVDIDAATCNVDPECMRDAITPKTEAIMVVHFGGQCCQMDAITAIAREHGLHLIEDSAETLGGTFKGAQAGSFGIGCFSFFPTKNITTGEGGMITTNDATLAKELKALLAHGMDSTTYQREKSEMPWFRSAVLPGYNFRMSNMLAALGCEQMKRLDELNQSRQHHAAHLIERLAGIPQLSLPATDPDCNHVYQMFTVRLSEGMDRTRFVRRLNELGVGASVHFYPPIHEQVYYRDHPEWCADSLAVTESVSRQIVTLPMYPGLKDDEVETIADAVKTAIEEQATAE